MSGLLVSVRNRQEAEAALDAGADLLDLKEPAVGALGAVSPAVMHEVAGWLASRGPLSVALGELATLDPRLPGLVPAGVNFAKLGLAGSANLPDWQDRWLRAYDRLPRGISPVAVVYADWAAASAPPPDEVLAAAVRGQAAAILIDTYGKQGGGLFDLWAAGALAELAAAVRAAGLKLVLAGSLNLATARRAAELQPDYIAVRGAVCRPSRAGRLDPTLVAELREILSGKPVAVG